MVSFGIKTEGIEVVKALPDQVKGHTFLITGPSPGGIGAETAISLAHGSPAAIILIGRNEEKIQPTIEAIKAINPDILVKFVPADLSVFSTVRAAATTILTDPAIPQLDVIINNAAIMATPLARNPDGYEMQFASNHLGHFLLTNLLRPKLAPRGRVVIVASSGHKYAGIQWDDPHLAAPGAYGEMKAYGQSKTANILTAVALNARGVRAIALNPGSIRTNLQSSMTLEVAEDAAQKITGVGLEEARRRYHLKSLQEGCATTLVAALDPALGGTGEAVYMQDCAVMTDPFWILPRALDKKDAERLWALSEELVGEKF